MSLTPSSLKAGLRESGKPAVAARTAGGKNAVARDRVRRPEEIHVGGGSRASGVTAESGNSHERVLWVFIRRVVNSLTVHLTKSRTL